jgi:hypothetical protein
LEGTELFGFSSAERISADAGAAMSAAGEASGAVEMFVTGEAQDLEIAAEFSGVLCDLGDAISVMCAEAKRLDRGGGKGGGKRKALLRGGGIHVDSEETRKYWAQAIGHLMVMLHNESCVVQNGASRTLAVLAEIAGVKEHICSVGIVRRLVDVVRGGGLDAIGTLAVLTQEHEGACNQARDAGGISLLVALITSASDGAEQRSGDEPDLGAPAAGAPAAGAPAAGAPAAGAGASAHPSVADGSQMEVPVASKAEVVATLRNIATASDENRTAVSREQVIPQLVRLMTKKLCDGRVLPSSAAGRLKLAEDTRRLAQSAGQMLFTMINEGSTEVRDLIIGAISTPHKCCLASRLPPHQCCLVYTSVSSLLARVRLTY